MRYKSLKECVIDLEKNNHLVRIKEEVDPNLEMAEIQRQVYLAKGPAIFFEKVKGSLFPAVSNIFGTIERARFVFRSTLDRVKRLIELKADPALFLNYPHRYSKTILSGFHALPKSVSSGPVLYGKTSIDKLPQIKSWPDDGGAFILLPQVYSEDPYHKSILKSNMGMYRIQMSGNDYIQNKELGLHYQIRRDIGIHHCKAMEKGEPLRVSIFVGGPPAHTFAAVMPLPEGVPEVAFAGSLAGRRFRYAKKNGFTVSVDADFCITGIVVPNKTLPEGPFGDHLGYYSLQHDFPVISVDAVYHRKDAIWPFTSVGRPPQEDTSFGQLIHELTGPMVPVSLPGLHAIHAVDAAGVHPLLLAIGKERYVPYEKRKPREIITLSNAILGFNHCSLAKYLFISALEDNPNLDINDIQSYFTHILERVDWRRDIHFHTQTTMDTLDYTGTGLNQGSKVAITVAGVRKRKLMCRLPLDFTLSAGFYDPVFVMPGILVITAPKIYDMDAGINDIKTVLNSLAVTKNFDSLPLIVFVDDSKFCKRFNNFLWVTFTRSNPATDIYGVNNTFINKHWGCEGPLVIDARLKPYFAPPLIEDKAVSKKVDGLLKTLF